MAGSSLTGAEAQNVTATGHPPSGRAKSQRKRTRPSLASWSRRRLTANSERAARFVQRIRHDRPDLTGGVRFVASPRHKGYVNSRIYTAYLRKVTDSMGVTSGGGEALAFPPLVDCFFAYRVG